MNDIYIAALNNGNYIFLERILEPLKLIQSMNSAAEGYYGPAHAKGIIQRIEASKFFEN